MKRYGIIFDIDENWIGGSYYIRNLVSALHLLPEAEQPHLVVIASHAHSFQFLRDTGYSKLQWITRSQFDAEADRFPLDALFPWIVPGQEDRTVAWIPDFQDQHFPHLFMKTDLAHRKAQHLASFSAAGLIVSSDDVARDVENFYPGQCKNIAIVNFAAFNVFDAAKLPALLQKYRIDAPYIMCPNQIWVHKNHIVVIKALEILYSRGIVTRLYFTGNESDYRATSYTSYLKAMLVEFGLADNVRFLGFLPREDQLVLMSGAEYIIQPSLFEGWSTVIEDAKAMNQIVVASDLNVHKEQLRKNFRLFPRSNPRALADIMEAFHHERPLSDPIDYGEAQKHFGKSFVAAMEGFSAGKNALRARNFLTDAELAILATTNARTLPIPVPATAPVPSAPSPGASQVSAATEIELYLDLPWFKRTYPRGPFRPKDPLALVSDPQSGRTYAPNAYFDVKWYASEYREACPASVAPFIHFLQEGMAAGLEPNPLFDSAFYKRKYPDVAASGLPPFLHFLQVGAKENRKPHRLFEPTFYNYMHRDLANATITPYEHFLKHGLLEGRSPHPIFDQEFYLVSNTDVAQAQFPAFLHFLKYGLAEDRAPNPFFDPAFYRSTYLGRGEADCVTSVLHFLEHEGEKLTQPHPLFDPAFYFTKYTDVAQNGILPFHHFLLSGVLEGRQPHPFFDPGYYALTYPDVNASGIPASVHFLKYGLSEGRRPHPLFDAEFYRTTYPEVDTSGLTPVEHFFRIGVKENRAPNAYFSPRYYLATYPDVASGHLSAYSHYVLYGAKEGRDPHPSFSTGYYLDRYPDVTTAGFAALEHYLRWGISEGRSPHPLMTPSRTKSLTDPLEFYARRFASRRA